ncbi:hypothetical protein DIPPA_12459 [Diplonema papillatum]|nr:hypothetical protein DIPPA_12459 [Diplonema papillatum]
MSARSGDSYRKLAVGGAAVCTCLALVLLRRLFDPTAARTDAQAVDVIIVPGGGQTPEGPPPHVILRLRRAAELYAAAVRKGHPQPKILCLSGGTPHKPNPKDAQGFDVKEAESSARYLISKLRIPAKDVLEEGFSLDTIGNAYFARLAHCEPAGYHSIAVVNNDWHLPRTRAIFDWVFGLAPGPRSPFVLTYHEVGPGLEGDALRSRVDKEQAALPGVRQKAADIRSVKDLHTFLFLQHGAYKSERLLQKRAPIDPALAKSY